MSIIGLTGEARLPRIGQLRKGDPKPNEKQPGADLTDELRFVGVDDEVTADWVATFGGDKIDQLVIRLPFPTVDENWSAWKEAYVTGGLSHRCDGRTVVLSLGADGQYDDSPRPCPGGCRPVGRLAVFVPVFQRLGTITVHTTSLHDIMNLDGCLRSLALLVGDLTRVPFMLKRVKRAVSTPQTDKEGRRTGKRARREKWLLHLEPAPEWVRAITAGGSAVAELADAQTLSLPAPATAALPNGNVHSEIVEGDAAAVKNGFRARIEACTTLDELRALWPDIQAIEEAAYKANVIALWRAQAVAVIRGMVRTAPIEQLEDLGQKLDQLPAGTPGRDEALRELEARIWAGTSGDDRDAALAPLMAEGTR